MLLSRWGVLHWADCSRFVCPGLVICLAGCRSYSLALLPYDAPSLIDNGGWGIDVISRGKRGFFFPTSACASAVGGMDADCLSAAVHV